MSRRTRLRTLPIRRWLVLALVAIVVLPVAVTGTVAHQLVLDSSSPRERARDLLREDPSLWTDPAWQAVIQAELASEGVDVVLFVDGQEIYRTTDDPLAGLAGDGPARTVEQVVAAGDPSRYAYVYADETDEPDWVVILPVIAISTLLLTLATIAWLIGRTVVRPLRATSRAARQVAGGDLDIELPASRVREVEEVNLAFEIMSADLLQSVEERAKLEEERRLFISSIAHDLRTPLFALRGYLEGLEQGIANTPEKRNRYLQIAQEKAELLEQLIADLFTYTRLEYLGQSPAADRLDLSELIRQLVDGLRYRAESAQLTLTADLPPGGCFVSGDSHLLTRVFENLFDNAMRYTPAGGTILVECYQRSETVVFRVSDSGPGIPEPDLPHLFTPLYRGESSRNRRTGGAGLGLSIARRIIQAHGGDLSAGNAPDGGAVFTGTLPAFVASQVTT